MSTRVLIADDHHIVCDGLRMVVESQTDMEVVATAHDGREALRLAVASKPDVVVMDVELPGLNGVDAARQILRELPGTKLIALSMYVDRCHVEGMLAAGATAYLGKECTADELVKAIRHVLASKAYLCPAAASVVVGRFATADSTGSVPLASPLTVREREVLQLIAEGHSTRQIGRKLFISIKTVEGHRRRIQEKLGVTSTAELIKYAIKEGITSLEF